MAGHETAEKIKPEVLEYIASKSQSEVRHLEGIINRLYLMILMNPNEEVNLEFVQKYLIEEINNNIYAENSVEKIKKAVADYYNVTVDTLKSKKRKAEINKARQVAIYLCTMNTDETVERIGLSFNRDHATVIHAREKITEDLKNSEQLKQEIKEIKDKI
jgi:chromosomal replication initiator protein